MWVGFGSGYDVRMNSTTSTVDLAATYRSAVDALNRSSWQEALQLATSILPAASSHAGVHFVAGVAAMNLDRMPLAMQHLQAAVKLNPSRADYGAQWARALAGMRMVGKAVEVANAAVASGPTDAVTYNTLGVVYSQANAHDKAIGMFRRAVELLPIAANFRFNLATSLTFKGEMEAAEREHEACLAQNPRYWKAHLALAQLRRQSPEDNHVERLLQLLEDDTGDQLAQMYLNLALSKEYEDLADRNRSFEHLVAGKAAGSPRSYSSDRDAALFEALQAAFNSTPPARAGHGSHEPIFVIGMPRSGTTLVDRILSSHSRVHSAGELPNFGEIIKRASGSRSSLLLDAQTIADARDLDWAKVGAAYVASTRPGTGNTPHFVDKLPQNFLYAGFIARALPNARIVCLRRNPMDTCLSNFRQLFTQTSPYYDYSFNLLDTGRYYLMFDRLMAHWQRVLPGRILEIDYEAIVESQEESTRRLLEFCGLPWEGACLRFEENEAPVSTASAVQVREPIYRSALQRWKRYEKHLTELRALLEHEGIVVG